MFINIKNKFLFMAFIILPFYVIACASLPPLPTTLNIVPPSSDVPPEIAAFSGIWEGKWSKEQDTILVIEKIDTQKADVIISLGRFTIWSVGIKPPNTYTRVTATVLPGPAIELQIEESASGVIYETVYNCPCKMTFKMNKELNMLKGYWEFKNSNIKFSTDLTRRKEK